MSFDDSFLPPSLGAEDSQGTAEISTEALWSVVGNRPSLVILEGPSQGRRIDLQTLPVVLGRSDDAADICVQDRGISKKHFLLSREGMAIFVQDLGSSNGTLVNGTRINRKQLFHGDAIAAGSTVFQFSMIGGDEDAQAQAESSMDAASVPREDEPTEACDSDTPMKGLLDVRSLAEATYDMRSAGAQDGEKAAPSREAAQQSDPAPKKASATVSPEERARVRRALALLNGEDKRRAFQAAEFVAGYGERALHALGHLFPGRVFVDRYAYAVASLPPVEEHGAVLHALVRIGEPSLRIVRHYINDQSNEVRFYATYLLTKLPAASLLSEIGRRLFDRDQQTRDVARHIALAHVDHPHFKEFVLPSVREKIASGDDALQLSVATEFAGQCHDIEAIPLLIQAMNGHGERYKQQAWRALRQIALQAHPPSPLAWEQWWKQERAAPDRNRWLTEALNSPNEELRALAKESARRAKANKAIHLPK